MASANCGGGALVFLSSDRCKLHYPVFWKEQVCVGVAISQIRAFMAEVGVHISYLISGA